MSTMSHISNGSIQDVGTPATMFDPLNEVFGFCCDLAASPGLEKCEFYLGLKKEDESIWEARAEEFAAQYVAQRGEKGLRAAMRREYDQFLCSRNSNSLHLPWREVGGWCWLNSRFYDMENWYRKAHLECLYGAKIVQLGPASTGASYFRQIIEGAPCSVFLLNKRLRFDGYSGPAGQDHWLIVWDRRFEYEAPRSLSIEDDNLAEVFGKWKK